jgi:multidrug efflux pump subunit AcrA (membrane-fusion protein)
VRATVTLQEFPDEPFPCVLVRNSGSIDPSSRTLLVEFDVNNAKGRILPGAYVQLHLKLPAGSSQMTVPSNTLLFRAEGIRVAVVEGGHARLVAIKIGRDYGSSLEVLSGLQPQDAVILDPSDSLSDGSAVRIHSAQDAK